MSDRGRRLAARVLFDVVAAVIFCVIVGIAAMLTGGLAGRFGWLPEEPWWRWALVPVLILLFVVGLILAAAVVRALLPRLKPGRYPFPWHAQSVIWLLHFSVQRFLYLPVWRHLLFSFSTFRWMLLRALGCRASFDIDTASDVQILDPGLVVLGPGVMIGAGAMLTGHVIERGTLQLGRIVLNECVHVGNNVVVGPGVTIGERTAVGPECRIGGGCSIGPFSYVGVNCWLGPGVTVGAHAVIHHQVSLEPGVRVGDRAVIGTWARIPRGTTIGDGVRYETGRPDTAV